MINVLLPLLLLLILYECDSAAILIYLYLLVYVADSDRIPMLIPVHDAIVAPNLPFSALV